MPWGARHPDLGDGDGVEDGVELAVAGAGEPAAHPERASPNGRQEPHEPSDPASYGTLRAANPTALRYGQYKSGTSVRQVTGWLTRHPTTLTEEDRAGLKDVLARCPELETAAGHVRDFGEILTSRLGAVLPAWIDAVDASQLPGLTGFALHLLRDLDAVIAGLTLDWSSGSIEGAVNRIKKIKRQLYGRAGFELLRKMILLQ
ncbi:transposase [Streptomyces mirabilis]|uniref:transposase n=1 Tax=Streptomyces mirabilis TaxID=68239 RepID=UPI003684E4B8